MPEGLVIECPVCQSQRPFNIDVENPPKLLEQRLKMSVQEHLEQAHDQENMRISQWNEVVETMFEAEIPQEILNQIEKDDREPIWDEYNLRSG